MLGRSHLRVAIDSSLADDEIQESPTRSWMLTVIYRHPQLPACVSGCSRFYERYPEHVFLREVIGTYVLDLHREADS